MENFLYVFSLDLRDYLLSENYSILKNDEKNNVYIFVNKPEAKFSISNNYRDDSVIFSNTLTF